MENDKDSRLFSLLNSFLDEKGDGSNDTSLLPLSLPTDYAETYLKNRPDEAEAPDTGSVSGPQLVRLPVRCPARPMSLMMSLTPTL